MAHPQAKHLYKFQHDTNENTFTAKNGTAKVPFNFQKIILALALAISDSNPSKTNLTEFVQAFVVWERNSQKFGAWNSKICWVVLKNSNL